MEFKNNNNRYFIEKNKKIIASLEINIHEGFNCIEKVEVIDIYQGEKIGLKLIEWTFSNRIDKEYHLAGHLWIENYYSNIGFKKCVPHVNALKRNFEQVHMKIVL